MNNKNEIRAFSVRRGGQHAILNWIMAQTQSIEPRPLSIFLQNPKIGRNPLVAKKNVNRDMRVHRSMKRRNGKLQLKADKDFLVYNHEDTPLTRLTPAVEAKHDAWVGTSDKRIDLLILRDPFNLIASRMKLNAGWCSVRTDLRLNAITALWKQHAREYLGETDYLKHNKTVVSFNRWFVDKDYRASIAAQVGVPFTDKGFNAVTNYGGGSSFSGTRFNGRASHMGVLHRWKSMAKTSSRFVDTFVKDPELVELSLRIFGDVRGTDA